MTTMEMTRAQLNGVNVEALRGARTALEAAPPAAEFTFKAASEWCDGVQTRMTINQFSGLGTEHGREQDFIIESDHPACFAATDRAPTPPEIVLAGLAGCLTGGIATVAEHRGIKLHKVKATVEADMNLFGILGIDADVRNGFNGIRVSFDIEAEASDEDIRALVAQSQKRSAVFDMLANPTSVVVSVK